MSETETYQGWSVRFYSQYQTLHPKPKITRKWYSGYDTIRVSGWDMGMPEFPLSVRYKDFKVRLSEAFNRLKVEDKPDSV